MFDEYEKTRKDDFVEKYISLTKDVENKYIFIDIKKKRLPEIETIIVRKENFDDKLKEIKFMYDDNMCLKVPEKDKENFKDNPPIIKVVGLYSNPEVIFD